MQRLEYVIKLELREFLSELLRIKKERNSQFSQRSYACHLGFTTSTFNELLKGKRKVTKKSIQKLLLGLSQDQDVEDCLKSWPSAPLSWEESSSESRQKALAELIKLSNVAKSSVGREDLFCVLIVATKQEDLEFLQKKVSKVVRENCDARDVFEVQISYLKN